MNLWRLRRGAADTVAPGSIPTTRGRVSSRTATRLAAAFLVGGAALAFAPTAAHAAPTDIVPHDEARIVNVKPLNYTTGNWRNCLHVGKSPVETHPVCSRNLTIGVHAEVTGGLSAAYLTAGFGFGVTESLSWGYGISADVPAHTAGNLQLGVYYRRYSAELQHRHCATATDGACGKWTNVKGLVAEKWNSPAARFVATAK